MSANVFSTIDSSMKEIGNTLEASSWNYYKPSSKRNGWRTSSSSLILMKIVWKSLSLWSWSVTKMKSFMKRWET
jgi:hypothetical protein